MSFLIRFIFTTVFFVFQFSLIFAQWEGKWSTGYGQLRLLQKGKKVFGDYSNKGYLEGTYSQATRTLTGTFVNKTQKINGTFSFVLNNDAKSFTGKWAQGSATPSAPWNGTKITGQTPIINTIEFLMAQGTWKSTYGTLKLTQSYDWVKGDYADYGPMYGTYDKKSRTLKGTFKNGEKEGNYTFTFAEDGKSFSGKWAWGKGIPNKAWTGTRVSSEKPRLKDDGDSKCADSNGSAAMTANIRLPFHSRHQIISYTLDNEGNMIFNGDIILGKEKEVLSRHGNGRVNNWYTGTDPAPTNQSQRPGKKGKYQVRRQELTSIKDKDLLWPYGLIPYVLDPKIDLDEEKAIRNAMKRISDKTSLKFVSRIKPKNGVNPHKDYVYFAKKPEMGCAGHSKVGRQGKKQEIKLGCFVEWLIMHEILHAAGFWHEQSRADRDSYVSIIAENLECPEKIGNFKKHIDDGVTLTAYDYKSIMHYTAFTFAQKGKRTIVCNPLRKDCPDSFGGTKLSPLDIIGVNKLYPWTMEMDGGADWGANIHTTGIKFGDIDGDGRDEVGVVRKSSSGNRIFLYDDVSKNYKLLFTAGSDWGKDNYATDIAFGDMDGDGTDEMAVSRKSSSNGRVFVYKYSSRKMNLINSLGSEWGGKTYATHVAFGDMNKDGKAELGVTRKADINSRVFIYTYNPSTKKVSLFTTLGGNWGKSTYATAIAFGDYTGDGKDEMAIGRKVGAKGLNRFMIYSLDGKNFSTIASGGQSWGAESYVTDLGFGNVANDNRQELGVTRYTKSNSRAFIFGHKDNMHKVIKSFGNNWGADTYATSIEFGDTDGDNKDEILIGRKASVNGRIFLYNDRSEGYDLLFAEGANNFSGFGPMGRDTYATSVTMGDLNGDNQMEYAVGLSYTTTGKPRWHIFK